MLIKNLCLILPVSMQIFAASLQIEVQKVDSYLIIGENKKAIDLAQNLTESNPLYAEAHLAFIKALCYSGEDSAAMQEWIANKSLLKEKGYERNILELLCWSILNKAQNSSLMPIVVNALQGASFTNDSKAIPLFLNQLRSPYAIVRAIAVRSCSRYGDAVLKDEIRRMLKEEKVWYVRLEVISALGQLRMKECINNLKDSISSPKTLAEEKIAAILAIVGMTDNLDEKELSSLLKSPRAGLRHLGCALIAYFKKWDKIEALFPLLKDGSVEVKIAALNAICQASQEKKLEDTTIKAVLHACQDPIPEVAVTAAWVAFLNDSKEAEKLILNWMLGEKTEFARLVSAALAASGIKGASLSINIIDSVKDTYAKFNLAYGLIAHRKAEKKALEILVDTLHSTQNSFLMWDNSKNPLFNSLSPSQVRHIDHIPNYPRIIDQLVRLNILNILSMRGYPKALEEVRHFLKTSDWGIVAEASALLLQEGTETQLDEVKKLLKDKDEQVKLQASLVLAFVGNDTSCLPVLMEVFPKMQREQKIQIMMALGHMGDPKAIPFFLQIMQEPFQQLKVLSASCLIQILYH